MELAGEPLSDQWFENRKGKITASRFNDVLNGTPAGWSRLLGELDGSVKGFGGNAATGWGTDHEQEAIDLFSFEESINVNPTGFWIMDDFPFIGGTPDGLIGADTTVQVKCPFNPEVHLKTVREQRIPSKYLAQVQGELMVTGRKFVWFISYDPRAKLADRLVKILIPRNQNYIDVLLGRLLKFWECYEGFRNPEEYFITAPKIDIAKDQIPKLF